jgi:hypothetical protein
VFGSVILDVAIGLILVYLLLSLIASALREGIESIIQARAVHLERGIRALLDDPKGTGLAMKVYTHPMVFGLFEGAFVQSDRRRLGRNLPTYIPARNFVQAVLDLTVRPAVPAPYGVNQSDGAITIETLRAAVARVESPAVQRVLRSAIDGAQGDIERVRKNLEAWFDSGMDRVSGWYKRRTQWVLLAIGFGVAVTVDVDTVRIAQHLYRTPESRAAAVAMAQAILADTTARARADTSAQRVAREALARLDTLGLPILWHGVRPAPGVILAYMGNSLLGWVVTALAVSLGAPFWFDLLNKIMVIRATVKPHEKSPEESSEDRQKSKPGDETADLATIAGAAAASAALAATGQSPPPGGQPPIQPPPTSPPSTFTAREWANAPEDGII